MVPLGFMMGGCFVLGINKADGTRGLATIGRGVTAESIDRSKSHAALVESSCSRPERVGQFNTKPGCSLETPGVSAKPQVGENLFKW